MFILTKIQDLITLSPSTFTMSTRQALEDEINKRLANKVIHKVGLCICLWDIIKASEGLIGYGNGSVNVNVEFRMVVFRPFKGEILTGRISSSSPNGINVRLDFFDDIFIPARFLFTECKFDHAEQVWVWHSENGDLYFDKNELIRFRIELENFEDKTPADPAERDSEVDKTPPYQLIGSCMQSGLGLVHWW